MKEGVIIICVCFSLAIISFVLSEKVNEMFILGTFFFVMLSVMSIFPIGDEEMRDYCKDFIKASGNKCHWCKKEVSYEKGGWSIPATRFGVLCDDCDKELEESAGKKYPCNYL